VVSQLKSLEINLEEELKKEDFEELLRNLTALQEL